MVFVHFFLNFAFFTKFLLLFSPFRIHFLSLFVFITFFSLRLHLRFSVFCSPVRCVFVCVSFLKTILCPHYWFVVTFITQDCSSFVEPCRLQLSRILLSLLFNFFIMFYFCVILLIVLHLLLTYSLFMPHRSIQ